MQTRDALGKGRWLGLALGMGMIGVALVRVEAADPFEEMVRTTPWLSPAEAVRSFRVPAGFEVQLVAAEPEIAKPISMSFDVEGRLWIAETRSYPTETATDKTPRDGIRILSEFGENGRAGRNEVFAHGLTMPDAVAPYGRGAIVFDVPNVVDLQDTDADGKADRREVVYGPFGARDTHNLANNFRRGFDGWFYGGQGVGNETSVKGKDGVELRMRGATFRFRADGSRIERVGDGQANVFGLCFDPLGHLFTSDCHSMPIYQVIHGGFYPVFGKPHDGLGYAPQMLWHSHGSTAIAGLIYCDEPLWPAEYQGNFFLGNVVTSRVNRDRLEDHGSTRLAREMPDLVSSTDPWFRPVDVQFGPDGAFYIADFYNRIIAHVEVPLGHPGRDKTSGRIWRVVRLGADGRPMLRKRDSFSVMTIARRVEGLSDPSFAHRLAVVNHLCDIGGAEVVAEVRRWMAARPGDAAAWCGGIWVLERSGGLTDTELAGGLQHPVRDVRTHAVRILVERREWSRADRARVVAALRDGDSFVVRAAADGLARHPAWENVGPLLELRPRIPEDDTHLVYQMRKALRDQLLDPAVFARARRERTDNEDVRALTDVAVAVPSTEAAGFLADVLARGGGGEPTDPEKRLECVRHVARHGGNTETDALAGALRRGAATDLDRGVREFQAILRGVEQRGQPESPLVSSWGRDLAARLLAASEPANPGRWRIGAELAGRYRVTGLEGRLVELWEGGKEGTEVGMACLKSLLETNPDAHGGRAAEFLDDVTRAVDRRAEIAQVLGRLPRGTGRGVLLNSLRRAPERFAIRLAGALCATPEGVDALMDAVTEGRAPARVLVDRTVKERIGALRPRSAERVTGLTRQLGPESERLQKLVVERSAAFDGARSDPVAGERAFRASCVVCHSLGGQGGNVGPQLDGIGHRGVERLCEDVLDPNRNVDRVFRQTLVTRRDGDVQSGLFRREEGGLLIFVDATGKEFKVPKADIEERRELESSLMPENFGEILTTQDLRNLLGFLLGQRGTAVK